MKGWILFEIADTTCHVCSLRWRLYHIQTIYYQPPILDMQHPVMSSSSFYPNAKPYVGLVENTVQALRLVQAVRLGVVPRIIRRLNDTERKEKIFSGAVFVFTVEESGMKRWTDGRLWSPSRIDGNFLVSSRYSHRLRRSYVSITRYIGR